MASFAIKSYIELGNEFFSIQEPCWRERRYTCYARLTKRPFHLKTVSVRRALRDMVNTELFL